MKAAHYPAGAILVVDDEPAVLEALGGALRSGGYTNVQTCSQGREVMQILATRPVEALLLDLALPHVPGQELLARIREQYPEIPVIVVTGVTEVSTAVECMKLGAFDYLVKAVEKSKLLATVSRAVEIRELRRQTGALGRHLMERRLEHPQAFSGLLTRDPKMLPLFLYAEAIAASPHTVLITGETGVGKELLARAIHRLSGRPGDFVAVNVAGLDETMFADTLFGHLPGAYTGAASARKGLIEQAAGGTLFLDEIGDLQIPSQVRLLRLLEGGQYYPLGSDLAKRSDARVVVATNQDLESRLRTGEFRKDLYYRLRMHPLHVPALRERPGDLPLLVERFVRQAAAELGRRSPPVPAGLARSLAGYSFPGNVRELKALVLDAVTRHAGGPLSLEIPAHLAPQEGPSGSRPGEELFAEAATLPTLRRATEMLVAEPLRRAGGNQARAARMLGISPQAVSKRLRRIRQ